MTAKSLEIVQRYLAGALDLEAAAHELHTCGDLGLHYSPGTISAAEQERVETLFGRVFWLSMREVDPARVPDEPFGAEEFRAIAKEMFGYTPGERPKGMNDGDPNGAA